jgi:glutamate-1-semialdehyde 2,1-aminomutase
VIPGGIHLSGRPLGDPTSSPMYMTSGAGCRVRDADGHAYIDYVMAFGPFLFGYAHPEIDAAACEQLARGSLLSMNHPIHIDFIEALVQRFPAADMGVFFRTGSEATTAALRIARKATGARKVVRAGYHGWHDWCLPLETYVPAGLDAQVLEFKADDPESLERCLRSHSGEIAAVIVAPEMVIPTRPGPLEALLRITHSHGALFILDEVKTAFRATPGSIQQRLGIEPDMTTLSKALGNGWPIAAVVGKRDILSHGADMHYSGTFHGDTASMAAALKVLELTADGEVALHVDRLGARLIDGLNEICRRRDVHATAFGEPLPCMPFMRFEGHETERREQLKARFYSRVFERGILLHPRHLWFISAAHGDGEIDATLEACDGAMRLALA